MTRRRPYDRRAWKIVRRIVLERARYQCEIRLPGCEGKATAVDHIVALQDGGAPFELSNLQATCKRCNSFKEVNRQRGIRPDPPHPTRDW